MEKVFELSTYAYSFYFLIVKKKCTRQILLLIKITIICNLICRETTSVVISI